MRTDTVGWHRQNAKAIHHQPQTKRLRSSHFANRYSVTAHAWCAISTFRRKGLLCACKMSFQSILFEKKDGEFIFLIKDFIIIVWILQPLPLKLAWLPQCLPFLPWPVPWCPSVPMGISLRVCLLREKTPCPYTNRATVSDFSGKYDPFTQKTVCSISSIDK